ncbi:MAG: guanylate kinase [Nitrospiria bacterium]
MDKKGLLFVVSAPSGAGKTSLCRDVTQKVDNLAFSISYTTRPPRPREVNGQDYFFVSEASFLKNVDRGDFIEWAKVHGHYYGTSQSLLNDWIKRGVDVILDIDSQGAMILKQRWDGGVYIYVLPPSFEVLKQRLIDRASDSPEEISRRLQKAREEIAYFGSYQYLIINREYEGAIHNMMAIIHAERVRMGPAERSWVENRFIHRFGGASQSDKEGSAE